MEKVCRDGLRLDVLPRMMRQGLYRHVTFFLQRQACQLRKGFEL